MHTITTAAAFAIAASLAAGSPYEDDSSSSGKSGKGSKAGDCTDCSADVLTRANTVTSLTYDTYGDNGVLNYQSLCDFCFDEEGRQTYLQAIEFTSGCLAYTDCLIGDVFDKVSDPSSDGTVTEGGFLTASVNTLCKAEQTGEKQPGNLDRRELCPTPDELCSGVSENSCNPSSAPSSQPSSAPSSACPCWSKSELTVVTADNVREPGVSSCLKFEGNLALSYEPTTDFVIFPTFEVTQGLFEPGTYECAFESDDDPIIAQISEEEFESCTQQIEDRCEEIGFSVTTVDCPCFTQQDLLVVTSDNVDADSCFPDFTLSSSSVGVSFGVGGFLPGEQESCFQEQGGVRVSQDISLTLWFVCGNYLNIRCDELGLEPDNVGEGAMLSKMRGD